MDSRTAGILVEPIQGEGGVNVPRDDYLPGLRKLCDEVGALLILDEIQTGMGRTGTLWAYEQLGVEPDVITVAKGLAGGLAIAGPETLPADARFDMRVRASIEIGDLPAAIRILLFWKGWSLSTDWYAWSVRP